MKQMLLTLWMVINVGTLPAATTDSTNSSAEIPTTEFISEIIPLKYAGVSDVASALNYLGGRSSGNPDKVKRLLQRASIPSGERLPGSTKVTVDMRSNSLLIFTSQSSMESIRRIVAKLDVALTQILIDAAVFEMRLPNARNAGGKSPGRLPTAAADRYLGSDARWLTNFVLVAGKLEEVFSYAAVLSNDFNATITSLLRDGGTNLDILQKPRILTTDGESGSIFVGRTVPYVWFPTSGYPVGDQRYQQLGPDLGLSVTPVIAAGGQMVMEIVATFDKVTGKTHVSGVGDVPNTSTSEARVSAILRDGEVLLVGGAIRTPQKKSSGRQPMSELIVLLRPTVVSTVVSNSSRPGDSR